MCVSVCGCAEEMGSFGELIRSIKLIYPEQCHSSDSQNVVKTALSVVIKMKEFQRCSDVFFQAFQ